MTDSSNETHRLMYVICKSELWSDCCFTGGRNLKTLVGDVAMHIGGSGCAATEWNRAAHIRPSHLERQLSHCLKGQQWQGSFWGKRMEGWGRGGRGGRGWASSFRTRWGRLPSRRPPPVQDLLPVPQTPLIQGTDWNLDQCHQGWSGGKTKNIK